MNDGKLVLEFWVPLRLGRGENNREVRGQRIGRIQAERQAVQLCWPKMLALRAPRSMLEAVRVFIPVPSPCTVTFTRVAPGRGLDPEENLPGSCKAVKDEVAAVLGVDDRDPRVAWKYEQERGDWGVRIRIEAMLPVPEVVSPKASMSATPKTHSRVPKKLRKPRDLTDALLNYEVSLRCGHASMAKSARELLALASPAYKAPRRSS
jgi:hypothetical protein